MSDMKVLRYSMAWMMLRFVCCLATSSLFARWKDSNSFILFSFHITHGKLLNNIKIEIFSLLFWLLWKFFSLQSCRAELPGIVVTLKESKSRFYRFHDCGTVETMRKYNSSSISWKNFQHTNTLAQKVGPFVANNEEAQKKSKINAFEHNIFCFTTISLNTYFSFFKCHFLKTHKTSNYSPFLEIQLVNNFN